MHVDEVMLALAHWRKSKAGGKDVAVLAEKDANGPKLKAVGIQGTASHETPIVNVLQGRDPGGPPNKRPYVIATTISPCEMSVGMAWKYPVDYIVYLQGGAVQKISITNDGDSFAGKAHALTGGSLKLTDNDASMPAHPWHDLSWLGPWFSWLKAAAKPTTAAARAKAIEAPPQLHQKRAAAPDSLATGLNVTGPNPSNARQTFRDRLLMHLAYALVREGWATSKDDQRGSGEDALGGGYNIGCILVDSMGKIIGWGLNLISTNKSFHAETLMLQSYLARNDVEQLPAGCTMYTSLESCHMCAGFAAEVGNGLTVIYGQKDELIVNNALERKVNGSSQKATGATFHPGAAPPMHLESGPAIDRIKQLFDKYRLDTRRLGATGFLYDGLSQYFYEREQERPGQIGKMLAHIASAPGFAQPQKAPDLPHLDLATTPVQRQREPLAHLDLARPSRTVADDAREAMNQQLMGAEMALSEHAVAFLGALHKANVIC